MRDAGYGDRKQQKKFLNAFYVDCFLISKYKHNIKRSTKRITRTFSQMNY